MMLNKGELFAKLGELLDDSDVRFSFAGEELEVDRIDMEAEMDEAWLVLVPKAETEEETGPWYIGRREDNPYVGKHRARPIVEPDAGFGGQDITYYEGDDS